jgi:serine-type D-Ala-D-Ala carboxypeptidase/endopeptidase (penicillin-binding protein 4)
MLVRDRGVAVVALSLLQAFTLGAGVAVANLTPERNLTPRPPSVAVRDAVPAAAGGPAEPDPQAKVPEPGTLAGRLAEPAVDDPPVNAVVIDAVTRRTLYDQGAHRPATPASTTKLVTSVAALASLGPDHRMTTRVVRDGDAIVLVGGGDPTLTARRVTAGTYPRYASLTDLARQTAEALKAAGLRQVRVDYDISLYEGGRTAAGWKPNYLPDGEVAPMSALTVDEGRTGLGEQERVADPALSAVKTFSTLLKRRDIKATAGRKSEAEQGAQELGAVQSPPMSTMVEHLMTVSDNDVAEALIRQVAVKEGKPASFAGGAQAVLAVLGRLGVAEGVQVNDGSGLSTRNRITPMALARIASLAADKNHPELRAAITGMPVAGFSGTLSAPRYTGRVTGGGAGVVRAKTGTLEGVSTLAGVAYDKDGRLLAFAFMLGDGESPVDAGRLDLLAAALAGCGC